MAVAFSAIACAAGFGFVVFQLVCPDPGEDVSTIRTRDGVAKHVLIEILIELVPFGGSPEVEVVLQFELTTSHGYDSGVRERSGVVGTNLLHEAVDLAELVKVELRDTGGDRRFGFDLSEGEDGCLVTGGTGLGEDGDEILEGAGWLTIDCAEDGVA